MDCNLILFLHSSYECGMMEFVDMSYLNVSVKNEKKLERINRIFHKVTTTDDPVIRSLSKKEEGNVLLLDEPTAGMARHDTNRTIETLKKMKESGMTKIIIEHDMHVVFSLADRISVLAQGAIIAEGTPEEIKGNPVVQEAYLGGAEDE